MCDFICLHFSLFYCYFLIISFSNLVKTNNSGRTAPFRLLTGHAVTGSFLHERMTGLLQAETSECRWCGSGKRESRHHLFTECEAWRPQIRRLWRRVGKDCGWKHPRAPAVRKLWREEATEAVLEFLRDTRVGCWTASRRAERLAEEADQGDGGEDGGPGPP